MKIGNREISSVFPPYIVAEISCNHIGSLDNALKLIEIAQDLGADAVKFQCYQAAALTLDSEKPDFVIKDGPWKGRKLYELYKKCETPRAWFPSLFKRARNVGIEIFSSVFSPEDVAFLESFNCPAYKIASMEIVDLPLIKCAAKTGKSLIISTGMAREDEIKEALAAAGGARCTCSVCRSGSGGYALLHCISGYPTPIEEADLSQFINLKSFCNVQHGISDHTIGSEVPIAATILGASIIEKHLMLNEPPFRYLPEDFDFSLRPEEFATMTRRVRAVWQAMRPSERKSEESSRQLRRSLYVVQDIKTGDRFTTENVRSIRPAYGMAPKELPRVLKSLAAQDIEAGTALKEDHLQ